jgi:hypothetical protein
MTRFKISFVRPDGIPIRPGLIVTVVRFIFLRRGICNQSLGACPSSTVDSEQKRLCLQSMARNVAPANLSVAQYPHTAKRAGNALKQNGIVCVANSDNDGIRRWKI